MFLSHFILSDIFLSQYLCKYPFYFFIYPFFRAGFYIYIIFIINYFILFLILSFLFSYIFNCVCSFILFLRLVIVYNLNIFEVLILHTTYIHSLFPAVFKVVYRIPLYFFTISNHTYSWWIRNYIFSAYHSL